MAVKTLSGQMSICGMTFICIKYNNRQNPTIYTHVIKSIKNKHTKRIIITKVRIVVTSGRETQAEGIREKQMGRYIIANVLFLKLGNEFTGLQYVIKLHKYQTVFCRNEYYIN